MLTQHLSQLITNVQDTENTLTLRYAKSIFSGRTHFGFLGPLFVGPMMSHRMQELLSFFALMVKSNLGSWILLAQKKKRTFIFSQMTLKIFFFLKNRSSSPRT